MLYLINIKNLAFFAKICYNKKEYKLKIKMFKKIILIFWLMIFTLGWVLISNNTYAGWADVGWDDPLWDFIQNIEKQKNEDRQNKDENKNSEWDFKSPNFKINISWGIWKVWWSGATGSTSTQKMNNEFWKIIKNLMIWLWMTSMALIIVWAWYILSNAGQDELLTKWKNIVIWWVMALIIALSWYFLIDAIWYILYK